MSRKNNIFYYIFKMIKVLAILYILYMIKLFAWIDTVKLHVEFWTIFFSINQLIWGKLSSYISKAFDKLSQKRLIFNFTANYLHGNMIIRKLMKRSSIKSCFKGALSGLRQLLAIESPLKWWKILSWFFDHVAKRLD